LSFYKEFKFYISEFKHSTIASFFPIHLSLLSHQTFYHLFLFFVKLFIIFFSFSLNFLSFFSPFHNTFYHLFLLFIFTFIPSNFLSSFYHIFSRSSSLLSHQTFYHFYHLFLLIIFTFIPSNFRFSNSNYQKSQVPEPLSFQNHHFRSIRKCCFSTIKYIF